jgi:hypothetical protein
MSVPDSLRKAEATYFLSPDAAPLGVGLFRRSGTPGPIGAPLNAEMSQHAVDVGLNVHVKPLAQYMINPPLIPGFKEPRTSGLGRKTATSNDKTVRDFTLYTLANNSTN